jgi:hypothetical protein
VYCLISNATLTIFFTVHSSIPLISQLHPRPAATLWLFSLCPQQRSQFISISPTRPIIICSAASHPIRSVAVTSNDKTAARQREIETLQPPRQGSDLKVISIDWKHLSTFTILHSSDSSAAPSIVAGGMAIPSKLTI